MAMPLTEPGPWWCGSQNGASYMLILADYDPACAADTP